MRAPKAWVATAMLLLLGGAAAADERDDVKKLPGYVDFDAIPEIGDELASVDIVINESLIGMVAAFSRDKDPELSRAIAKLKQIRVQSFEIEPDRLDDLERTTDDLSRQLERQGWQTLLRVRRRGDSEQTYIYTKWSDEKMQGLVVMNIDPHDEASFVNIVGEIDLDQIRRIGNEIDIDALDSLDTDLHGLHWDRDRDKDKESKR